MTKSQNNGIGRMSSYRRILPYFQQLYSKFVPSNKINKSVRIGIPFIVFVIGGSFGLKEWTQIRYQFRETKSMSQAEAENMGLKKAKKVTVESVYEEVKDLDIDNWENKRGPRPWESNIDQQKDKQK